MKKIIIFTTIIGGNTTVSNVLKKHLDNQYHVQTSLIFTDVLKSIDFVHTITRGQYIGEKLYYYLLFKKKYFFINVISLIAYWYFKIRNRKIGSLVYSYMQQHNTDLVISVVPLLNNIILEQTKKLGIPLLIVPTDLDATIFTQDIKPSNDASLYITVAFNDKDIRKTIPALNEQYLPVTGFVLRPDFFEPKDHQLIKQTYGIPHDKPVILLLMGSQGSESLTIFAQKIAQINIPAHLVVCLGKNEEMRKAIEVIPFPSHITTSIIGYTPHIADLMAVSDLLITKSGTVSVCEAIYMNLPMLLDSTSTVLRWEQFNHYFIQKYQFGAIVKQYDDVISLITKFLTDKHYATMLKNNLNHFEKKHGGQEIKHLVATILQKNY